MRDSDGRRIAACRSDILHTGPQQHEQHVVDAVIFGVPGRYANRLQTASGHLDAALADKSWTAAIEQQGAFENLAPAVVLDIDETVLDNSPYQGQVIMDGTTFTPGTWDKWIARAEAGPVRGAAEVIREAKGKGVAVIFITNRTCRARSDQGSPAPRSRIPSPISKKGHCGGYISERDPAEKGAARLDVGKAVTSPACGRVVSDSDAVWR